MDRYRVKPGTRIDLSQWDPNDASAFDSGEGEEKQELLAPNRRLDKLQEFFPAEGEHMLVSCCRSWPPTASDACSACPPLLTGATGMPSGCNNFGI